MPLLIALLLGLFCVPLEAAPGELQAKQLTEKEASDLSLRGWRDRRMSEFDPPVTKTVRPSDYVDERHRGTIEFSSTWHNYSFHRVKIADGTVVDGNLLGGCNFTQIAPATEAIVRDPGYGHNLTFQYCNLTNLQTHPDWIVENSNTAQVDFVGAINEDDSTDILDVVFVDSSSSKISPLREKVLPAISLPEGDNRSVQVLE